MEKVYDKCCGVDIHKKLIVACFKQGRKQENREFGASTRELLEMAQWLEEGGCEQVAIKGRLASPNIDCGKSPFSEVRAKPPQRMPRSRKTPGAHFENGLIQKGRRTFQPK